MKTFKLTWLGRLILIPSIFLSFSVSLNAQELQPGETIIDAVAMITLHTSCGDIRTLAKFDSGADGSSVDAKFAKKLCLNEPFIGDTKNTHCENGLAWADGECRERIVLSFTTETGTSIKGRATLSNKADDRYPVLIGNREMLGLLVVRPVYETTTDNWSLDDYELEAEEEEEN